MTDKLDGWENDDVRQESIIEMIGVLKIYFFQATNWLKIVPLRKREY